MEYQVQLSDQKDRVWVHASDGSTVGRFSRNGVDIHTPVSDQLKGAPQCEFCIKGPCDERDWVFFRAYARGVWGVDIPEDSINMDILKPHFLPHDFMEEYGPADKNSVSTMFGAPISELSRDELIAVINFSQHQLRSAHSRHIKDLEMT